MTDDSPGASNFPPTSAPLARFAIIVSALALLAVITSQLLGPRDLFHQTQPTTTAYTTDMLLHGRWILPRESGEHPATKPPLYNWLAAPIVWALGFDNELAHKMPSVIAFIACCALVFIIAKRFTSHMRGDDSSMLAACASLMLLSNFTIHKLGYLARPDMLLALWLFLAWWSATELIIRSTHDANTSPSRAAGGLDGAAGSGTFNAPSTITNRHLRILFWSSIALAWMTKGPAAIVALIYALVAARFLSGRFAAARALWWWGLPLSLIPFVAWFSAAWSIDPQHVMHTLLWDEFLGRIVGSGSESPEQGPVALVTGLLDMPYYFLVRGLPWSIFALIGLFLLWRRRRQSDAPAHDLSLRAAALWVIVLIVVFSLSAGKRADYIAPAYPVAAILAAWTHLRLSRTRIVALVNATLAAAITLIAVILNDSLEWSSPFPRGHGRTMDRFTRAVREIVEADPGPLAFWRTPDSHLQTMLGENEPHSDHRLIALLESQPRFWLVAGGRARAANATDDLLRQDFFARFDVSADVVLSSDKIAGAQDWPRTLTLYRIEREAVSDDQ